MNKEFDKQMQRLWYMSFCNNDEIDRIISPKNPADYLLQQRADIVADNTRYYRVYLHKSNLVPNWSFEKSFNNFFIFLLVTHSFIIIILLIFLIAF